jgi:membrane protease YdiL (CAAX protease family)
MSGFHQPGGGIGVKAWPVSSDSHRGPSVGNVFFAYGLLLVGFVAIGFSVQPRWPIAGLWITEVFAIALPAVMFLRGGNLKAAPWLGLNEPSLAAVGLTLLASLANQPAIAFLEWAAQQLAPRGLLDLFQQKNALLEIIFAQHKWGMIAAVTIAAPIGEELFFRGFAQPALEKRLGVWPALVITGALFAAIHLDPVGFIGLWQLGILFGVARHATGSLWASIIAHAANNGIAAAAFLLGMNKPEEVPPPWLLVLGALIFVGGIALAAALARRPSPRPARAEPADSSHDTGGFRLGRAALPAFVWVASLAGGVALLLSGLQNAK